MTIEEGRDGGDLADLLSLIAERHSGCAQAVKRRKKLRDPDGQNTRAWDAGFHAGWEALRTWLLQSRGANVIPEQLSALKEERRQLKEKLASLKDSRRDPHGCLGKAGAKWDDAHAGPVMQIGGTDEPEVSR